MGTMRAFKQEAGIELPILIVNAQDSVLACCRKMRHHMTRVAFVSGGERAIGAFTEGDLLVKVVADELDPSLVPVSQVMSFPLYSVPQSCDEKELENFISIHGFRQVPMTNWRGEIVRLVSSIGLLERKLSHETQDYKSLMSFVMADGIGG